MSMTRRRFAAVSAAALGGAVLGRPRFSSAQPARPRGDAHYALVLLGDLHFDKPEHHDMDWVRREKPNDIRQIEGYIASTRDHMPALFSKVRARIAASAVPVAAVVQIGDFVEGLCGSYDLQALQFRDATAFVERKQLGAPFLLTKGNHDITGPGAKEAFNDVLLPWMSAQAGTPLATANYTWRRGDDLFVFFDAYEPDMAWLESLGAEASAARHVFFVIHPPVVPYNARATWHVFAKPRQQAERERLLAWLGRHHAHVLSGHLHRYAHLLRNTGHGPFGQLAVNSVVREAVVEAENRRAGLDDYGPSLVELEPNFSPDTIDERRALLTAERPHITAYDFARTAGHAVLWVYDDRVEAEVYLGYTEDLLASPRISVPSA
jgi:hypothetical protein